MGRARWTHVIWAAGALCTVLVGRSIKIADTDPQYRRGAGVIKKEVTYGKFSFQTHRATDSTRPAADPSTFCMYIIHTSQIPKRRERRLHHQKGQKMFNYGVRILPIDTRTHEARILVSEYPLSAC